MKLYYYLVIALVLPGIGLAATANDVVNTPTRNTIVQNVKSESSQYGAAVDWQLTHSDWQRYTELMKGQSGHYYKQLTPPEVLGINAENPENLRHYAEVAARLAHDRLARELQFNTAFREAAVRLYAKEPIINPFDFTPFTPIHNEPS